MDFQFEKNKLNAYLGNSLVELLAKHKSFVAGGTITSIFSNREINDVDIYFRDEDSVLGFISDIWDKRQFIVSHTKKATQIVFGDVNIQLIHFQYFNSPEEIFDTFDYTSCMGCYDFFSKQFTLHQDFLKHNSQRILKFNSNTAFPIVSLLRVQKYENKGYTISKPEFIRVILTCMNLEIDSYEELKEHLGGMYGVNYDKLFEDIKDEEFDLQTAIDKIANIALSEDYFKKPTSIEFNNLDDILDSISKIPRQYLSINNNHYIIGHNNLLREVTQKPDNTTDLDVEDYFKENKFYKFVKKAGEKYFSFYDEKFEYIIGKEIVAKNTSGWEAGNGQLYLFEKNEFNPQYKHNEGSVLLELEVKPENFIDADEGDVRAKKVTVIREVPKEEWSKWEEELIL